MDELQGGNRVLTHVNTVKGTYTYLYDVHKCRGRRFDVSAIMGSTNLFLPSIFFLFLSISFFNINLFRLFLSRILSIYF